MSLPRGNLCEYESVTAACSIGSLIWAFTVVRESACGDDIVNALRVNRFFVITKLRVVFLGRGTNAANLAGQKGIIVVINRRVRALNTWCLRSEGP